MNLENKEITTYLDEAMMEYSAYVLLHRALPLLTDGLKPSYRRILYTMLKNDTTSFTKSATVEGKVMEIHPHSGTYPTIVNMTQKDTNNVTWITGKGSFAYHTSRDMQPASSRYTEIKLSPYAVDMMKNLKKDIVQMNPTFDGTSLEPLELPVQHPQILTISQQGLGVGFSTNIASFNLTEVCQATIDYIEKRDIPTLIPDLATGGFIIDDPKQFLLINETGKGTFKIRARYEVDGQYILIKEIPFTTTREEIIDKIIELVKVGKLKDVVDIKDTTDINGMEIEIKIKKNANANSVMSLLYNITPLESSFPVNMTILDDNRPKVLGVKQIIPKWVDWRRSCLKRWLTFEVKEKQDKLHVLKGLEKCLLDINKAVDIIRNSDEDKVIDELCKFFSIDVIQAEEVASMKLREINKDKIIKKIRFIETLEKEIADIQETINSTEKLNLLIIEGLEETKKKYGHKRRSEVIKDSTVSADTFIEDYNCHILITEQGYIKKTLKHSDSQKLKDGDYITQHLNATNKDKLLLFTDKANCYYLNVYDLQTCQPSALGTFLPTLLNLEKDECIVKTFTTNDFTGYLLFAYENGKVAKINMDSYKTKYNRTKIINAYNTDSTLLNIHYINDDTYFTCVSSIDKVLVFDTSLINPKSSKTSQGVNVLKSKKDSHMIQFEPCDMPLEERDYYYIANIPAIGKYLQKRK